MGKQIVYIVSHALTQGIRAVEGEIIERPLDGLSPSLYPMVRLSVFNSVYREGENWARTPKAAIAVAEAKRIKKIASVKRQLANLEKMKFTS